MLSLTPDNGANDQPTSLTISGTSFSGNPSIRLGDTWLEDVVLVDSTTITAVLPAGMLPGIYDLRLYNGDCQEATLLDAFTVSDEGLLLTFYLPAILK